MIAEIGPDRCAYLRPGLSPVRTPRASLWSRLRQMARALRVNMQRSVRSA
jgi:hypothetical protein